MAKIAVIGAGVIGLSTARCLQISTSDAQVTIIADSFSPHTTSDGAFGIWEPYFVGDDERVQRWGTETYQLMMKLAHSAESAPTGTYTMSGVALFRIPRKEPAWKSDVAGFRHLTESDLSYYPPEYRYGWGYTTMVTECKYYLTWLMNKFLEAGGNVVNKRIASLSELSDYDVVVNCTGLGALELVGDQEMYPIRGHIIRVDAPWLRHFTLADYDDLYILSGRDGVVLGGTHDSGDWDTRVSLETRKRIWEGCCRLEPSLKAAKVLGEWVGLRPGRTSVRLEHETVRTDKGTNLQVIHNYGHGGAGVTLHWGCAREATDKVIECLRANNKIKQSSKL